MSDVYIEDPLKSEVDESDVAEELDKSKECGEDSGHSYPVINDIQPLSTQDTSLHHSDKLCDGFTASITDLATGDIVEGATGEDVGVRPQLHTNNSASIYFQRRIVYVGDKVV